MASEVPEIVGVVSPVVLDTPPVMVSVGAVVSVVSVCVAVAGLPEASATVAVTVWPASANVAAVTDQVPSAATTAVNVWDAIVTVTVRPMASEVPAMVGVPSLVKAVSPPLIVNAGELRSTVSSWVAVSVLPAASETDTYTVWSPEVNTAEVTDQVPSAATTAVNVWVAIVPVTVRPIASEVPETVGVVSFVRSAAPPTTVNVGGVLSNVNVWVALVPPPARFRTFASTAKVVPVRDAAETVHVPDAVTVLVNV
jgi:hypothetical protein